MEEQGRGKSLFQLALEKQKLKRNLGESASGPVISSKFFRA